MNAPIISLTDWLETPPGSYLLAWEREQFDRAVSDIFGYHALQLGLSELDTLSANRMPHRWLAPLTVPGHSKEVSGAGHVPANSGETLTTPESSRPQAAFITDSSALPFPANSLDLVVLPHTLELSHDPHATLREVERVLVPEGRVVICGFNPTSLWGLRQRRARLCQRLGHEDVFLPGAPEFIGYWRLRDWLRLLSFEVESGRFGCYRPAFPSQKWLARFDWMDKAGDRWWPIFGAVYFLIAVKRVRGVRLLEPAWKSHPVVVAPTAVANKESVRPTGPQA